MSKICNRCDAVNDDFTTKCINCDYEFKKIQDTKNTKDTKDTEEQNRNEIDIEIIESFLDGEPGEKKFKKKRKNELRWIVFGFLIPSILVGFFFLFFYSFLFGVEHYSPEVYLNQYLDMIKAKDYKEVIKYIEFQTDGMNGEEQFAEYMEEEYGENPQKILVAKSLTPQTEDAIYYNIQAKDKDVKEFKLVKTGKKYMNYFDEWKIEEPEKNMYMESVKIYTPKEINIYVNGVLLTDEYLVESEWKNYDEYDVIKDKNYPFPKEICYEVENLISVLSVEAKRNDGSKCELTLEDNVAHVTANIPDSELEYFKELAEKVAKTKSEFICEEAYFAQLREYLYEDTEFFTTMKEFYNGWFPIHDTYAYDGETRFSDMKWYDENHCSIRVEIDCYVTRHGKRTDYPVKDEIFFAKIDGEWLVANVRNF